MYKALGTIPNS